MKYILIFWGIPMGLLWGWFGLSYYDMHFGMLFLTRAVHDFVFDTYGAILGVDPAIIPPLVAKACIVDSAIIFGLFGLKRRKQLWAWWNARRSLTPMPPALTRADRAPPAE